MVFVRKASRPLAFLASLILGLVVNPANGATILSPSMTFVVGIDYRPAASPAGIGNLFDPDAVVSGPDPIGGAGVGFRRRSDGFDPIKPGTPIEGWGVSA